jgi:Domain of Unknown Function (DUF928)
VEVKYVTIIRLIFLSTLLSLNNELLLQQSAVIALPKPCNPPSSEDYALCMGLGYKTSIRAATRKTALEYFRNAQKLRPSDVNATKAVQNLERQMQLGEVMHVTPSGIGAPSNRAQAATRNQNCLDGKKLVALIPENQLGLTSMSRPTLLFYIPPTTAPNLKFSLEDKSGKAFYTKTLKTLAKTGLVQFKFSEFKDSASLTPGKTYQWTFTLLCDPKDPSANVAVSGDIQRIELDPILTSALKTVKLGDRAALYSINGVWYDTIATLAEALQADPSNPQLTKDWQELLKSSGLLELLEANH